MNVLIAVSRDHGVGHHGAQAPDRQWCLSSAPRVMPENTNRLKGFLRRRQLGGAPPDEPPAHTKQESKPTGGKVPLRRDLIERGGANEARQ